MTSVRYVLKLTGQLAKEIVVYDRGLVTRTEDPAIFAKPLLVAIVMEDGQNDVNSANSSWSDWNDVLTIFSHQK